MGESKSDGTALDTETIKYRVEKKMVHLARYDGILEEINALYDSLKPAR
jgi:hypothetical protein